MPTIDIEALEKEAAAEEEQASAAKLTPDEERAVTAIARRDKAREERAANEAARREIDMTARVAVAKAAIGSRAMVKGIDLVSLFPLGEAPPMAQLPGNGVIVVRSPEAARMKAFHAEAEAKKRPLADLFSDIVIESTIDPDPKDPTQGMKLRAFCDAYPGAAIGAGDQVAKLGGSKAQADKRGRG